MNTRRIDFVDTDLVTGWGELNTAPKHEPILRPDSAQCCGDCGQGRKACPSPMVCLGLHRVELANGQTCATDAIHRADVQQAGRLLKLKDRLGDAVYWIAAAVCIALMFAAPRAFAADAETTATIAAGADTVSTIAAVGSGAAVESNALIANPAAFAAVSALKLAAPRLTRDMPHEQRKPILQWMSGLWAGAGAHNIVVLLGYITSNVMTGGAAAIPAMVGIAWGRHEFVRTGEQADAEEAQRIAKLQSAEQVAMVQP